MDASRLPLPAAQTKGIKSLASKPIELVQIKLLKSDYDKLMDLIAKDCKNREKARERFRKDKPHLQGKESRYKNIEIMEVKLIEVP